MRWLLVAVGLVVPSVAAAHVTLTYPPPRTAMQKIGPCGEAGSVRGTNVATLSPGATITVTWNETIQHPGHYRIAFDMDGQDFTNPPSATTDTSSQSPNLVIDMIPDATTMGYSKQITLPNVTCTNCTLQLIQLMTDKPPYDPGTAGDDIYYQCADITLAADAPDAGTPPDAPPAGMPDSGTGSDSDAGVGGGFANPYANRGCSTSSSGSLVPALFALLLVRRRRHRSACC